MRRNVVVHHSCEYNLHEEVNRRAMALTGDAQCLLRHIKTRRNFFLDNRGATIFVIFLNFRVELSSVAEEEIFFALNFGYKFTFHPLSGGHSSLT